MHIRVQIIAIAFSLTLIAGIFELVRRRRLREEYSLLWLLAGLCLFLLSIDRPVIARISDLMGISYGPSALFMVATLFGLLLAIHFSLIVSQLTERTRILAQQNALLHLQLRELKESIEAGTKPSEAP